MPCLVTLILPGKGPCTESNLSICAFISTEPRSLIATNCRSLRPLSKAARSTWRPIRPNPLIATRTAIVLSSGNFLFAGPGRPPGRCSETFLGRGDHRLRGDAEMYIERLVGSGSAEAAHADEDAVGAEIALPAEAHAGLDADAQRALAEHRPAVRRGLAVEQAPARHGDHRRAEALA